MQELGGIRTKAEIGQWFNEHYPNRWKSGTLVGHLYGCSTNNPKGVQHHPGFPRFLFAHGNGRYELHNPAQHGTYENGFPAGEQPELTEGEPISSQPGVVEDAGTGFAYEAHLRDYLARHLELLEGGLTLWSGTTEESVEYPVDGRRIDILAKDSSGTPVVIELKVSRGHERTVGQCLYYRGIIKQQLSVAHVRLFIVAEEISPELKLAAHEANDVTLFEYNLSMTVDRLEGVTS
jgi:hypothetical protein